MSDYILHMEDGTELYHHGIPNQKHGVRHGPPYPLDKKVSAKIRSGKKVRAKSIGKKISSVAKKARQSTKKLAPVNTKEEQQKKRKLKDLSDDELRARINRINLEQEYKDLVKPKKTKDGSALFKSVGKDIYQKFLLPAGQDVAKNLVAPYIVNKLGTMINKKIGIDIIDTAYSMNKSKQSDQSSQQTNKSSDQKTSQTQNTSSNSSDQNTTQSQNRPPKSKKKKNKRSRQGSSNSSDVVIDLDDDWELIIPSRNRLSGR